MEEVPVAYDLRSPPPQLLSLGFHKVNGILALSPPFPPPLLAVLLLTYRINWNSSAICKLFASSLLLEDHAWLADHKVYSSRRMEMSSHITYTSLGTLALLIFFFDGSKPSGFPFPVN